MSPPPNKQELNGYDAIAAPNPHQPITDHLNPYSPIEQQLEGSEDATADDMFGMMAESLRGVDIGNIQLYGPSDNDESINPDSNDNDNTKERKNSLKLSTMPEDHVFQELATRLSQKLTPASINKPVPPTKPMKSITPGDLDFDAEESSTDDDESTVVQHSSKQELDTKDDNRSNTTITTTTTQTTSLMAPGNENKGTSSDEEKPQVFRFKSAWKWDDKTIRNQQDEMEKQLKLLELQNQMSQIDTLKGYQDISDSE